MKAIMISIKPKWCAKILTGEKTIEIRKSKALSNAIQKLIDEYGYAEFYVHCTKGNILEYFYDSNDNFGEYITHKGKCWGDEQLNGKVIFKFRCYRVEEIIKTEDRDGEETWYETYSLPCDELLEGSCLTEEGLDEYLGREDGTCIHISDLEIFDKPEELSEFKRIKIQKGCLDCPVYGKRCNDNEYIEVSKGKCLVPIKLTKAPQHFVYVEV